MAGGFKSCLIDVSRRGPFLIARGTGISAGPARTDQRRKRRSRSFLAGHRSTHSSSAFLDRSATDNNGLVCPIPVDWLPAFSHRKTVPGRPR